MSLSPLEVENQIGSASMQTPASNNLVFTEFSSFKRSGGLGNRVKHARFYQGIARALSGGVHTNQTLADFGARLISVADHAYALRELDIVGCAGQLLSSLPVSRQSESVGHYYQALSLNRGGRGDTTRARALFEQVADRAPMQYRAKAMLALGTNSVMVGDHKTAMSLYREVMRILARDRIFDPVTLCVVGRMSAVLRGMGGNHRGALSDLEMLFQLARMAGSLRPYAYYDYLNNLAVELGEVGRLEEARNASQIVLASPFAPAYPEWRETREEIELRGYRASRSTVAVTQNVIEARNKASRRNVAAEDGVAVNQENTDAGNIVTLPTARRDSPVTSVPTESQPLARVIKFPSGTSSMSEENERDQFELSEKQTFVADKLYDMFMSTLQGQPIDLNLVDKLYKVFLVEKRKGD